MYLAVLYGCEEHSTNSNKPGVLSTSSFTIGYTQSTAGECIHIRRRGGHIEVITVSVDDLGLFANSKHGSN